MPDIYSGFEDLSENENAGVDYEISFRQTRGGFAIVAAHGGGIEPGMSETADAIAGADLSFCTFEALKSSANIVLHVTSTRFRRAHVLNGDRTIRYSGHHPRKGKRSGW
jgi:phage replication-related protein YjqB (UPF0714/DUF867 family)